MREQVTTTLVDTAKNNYSFCTCIFCKCTCRFYWCIMLFWFS